jgi:hypothetical protein
MDANFICAPKIASLASFDTRNFTRTQILGKSNIKAIFGFTLKNIDVEKFHWAGVPSQSSEHHNYLGFIGPPSLPLRRGSLRSALRSERRLVGWQGLEPWTNALKGHCSTD